jgi:sugar-specific transcriptional regulator TrmB
MPRVDPISALVDLGFTALEAEVYTLLVRESPSTGYRVAQALGKAAANVYKAIESLERKGAVMVDDGDTRLCRPVPLEELLTRLERTFTRNRRRAARAIAAITGDEADDRVYRLRSREQVIARARGMLDAATTVALVDVFPEPFDELRDALAAAAARGVDVAVQVYAPAEVPGAEVSIHRRADRIRAGWPGEQLNVVTDATACLLALLSPGRGEVLQAIWSESTYLSCLMHSTLAADTTMVALSALAAEDAPVEVLRRAIRSRRRLISDANPGYRTLLERYAPRSAAEMSRRENRPATVSPDEEER